MDLQNFENIMNFKRKLNKMNEHVFIENLAPIKTKSLNMNKTPREHLTMAYAETNGVEFNRSNKNCELHLDAILKYFSNDDSFVDSPLLNKSFADPSLTRGLIIIGDYGVGKSSLMKSLPLLNKRIKFHYMPDVITQFNSLQTSADYMEFHKKYENGERIFDDLTTESLGNNYGKINVGKEIFLKRYENKRRTHFILNYDNNFPGNIEKALDKTARFYDDRLFDRMIHWCNILEFKGISLRRKYVK